MKRADYVSQSEMKDIYILGGVHQGICDLIDTTKEKDWQKYLKTINTLLMKITDERLKVVDDVKELAKLKRRIDGTMLYWTSKDGVANNCPPECNDVRLSEDEFFTICECAMRNQCDGCKGDHTKCVLRNAMQECGVPAITGNPQGKCEYWVEK